MTDGAKVPGAAPEPAKPREVAVVAGVNLAEIELIVAGVHYDPHSILGAHPGPGGYAIRTLRPFAATAAVLLEDGRRFPMEHVHLGVFAAIVPYDSSPTGAPAYRIAVAYPEANGTAGPETITDDPYRFLPTLGEVDLYLIGEGRHEELWRALGAHVRDLGHDGLGEIIGTSFTVWAPSAQGLRVIGDFNHWNGQGHPMRSLGGAGVWELFLPGVGECARYKFDICGQDGIWRAKADPMAEGTERPPGHRVRRGRDAPRVAGRGVDGGAAQARDGTRAAEHLRGAHRLLAAGPFLSPAGRRASGLRHRPGLHARRVPAGGRAPVRRLLGLPGDVGYYAPSSRFGSPDDFRYLVDRLHQAGIGVIIDWVPAHFPRDDWALARFDGTPLYEHADPRRGRAPGLGHATSSTTAAPRCATSWSPTRCTGCRQFHIDGLRVDAVASMLYLDYCRKPGEWLPNQYGGRENLEADRPSCRRSTRPATGAARAS